MNRAQSLLLCVLALAGAARAAGQGAPIVRPFGYYGIDAPARDAVLGFARTSDGELIAGSNVLAVYDGWRWQTIDVPGGYGFRGLAAARAAPGARPRVWVGGNNAVGYVEPDATGRWRWTSLQEQMAWAGIPMTEDVLLVQATDRGAIWVTSSLAFAWDGSAFKVWPLPAQPHLFASKSGDAAWIYRPGTGLLECGEDGPKTVFTDDQLPAKPVLWTLGTPPAQTPAPGAAGDRFVIGTNNAVYVRDGPSWTRLASVSAVIEKRFPQCATWTGPDTFAVGTLHGGVVLATTSDRVTAVVDGRSGLNDEAVYSLSSEGDDTLWLGSGTGMLQITALGRAEIFDRQHGTGTAIARKVLAFKGRTYVVTAQGVYAFVNRETDPQAAGEPAGNLRSTLALAADIPGLISGAAVVNGSFWVAGRGGIWRIEGDGAHRELRTPDQVEGLVGLSRFPGTLVFTEGHALKALVSDPATKDWSVRDYGVDLENTPVSLVEDASGALWVSTMAGGVFRFEAERDTPPVRRSSREGGAPPLRLTLRLAPGRGLPEGTMHPNLTLLGGRLCAFAEHAILALNDKGTAFEPVEGLSDFIGIAAAPAPGGDGSAFWLVQRRDPPRSGSIFLRAAILLRVKQDASGSIAWEPLRVPGIENSFGPVSLDVVSSDDHPPSLWVGSAVGSLRCDIDALRPSPPPPRVAIRQVVLNTDQRGDLRPASAASFKPGAKRLEFDFSVELPNPAEALLYQTSLGGVETVWTPVQRVASREFTGLAPGNYVLRVRTADPVGRTGPETRYAFTMLAPWWSTWPAYAAYAVVAAAFIAAMVRWRLARLSQQNERLNRLVADRTRELALANAAKGEFLENVSHEIRNPLNGIVGLIGMLRENNLQPREREVSRSLKSCAQALGRVFDEVLNFAKLEYGAVKVENKPLGLQEVLEDVQRVFSVTAAQRGSTISVLMPPDFRDGFSGDEGMLKSIVGNFVSNALKYAPGSPVEIRVSCEDAPSDPGAALVTIEVVDRGPGIPADEQGLVFQKFVRGSEAKASGATGAGLGLAACQAYARLLGGVVGMESPAPGVSEGGGPGSMFYLQLTLARGPLPDSTPAIAADLHGAGSGALIVEDQEYNRIVLTDIAQELGFVPDEAASGAEARAKLSARSYGVVFLDWELPDEKGTDVARWLRAQSGGSGPVVIATTAHDGEAARRRCRESGMDAFALKPFSTERIRELIAAVHAQRLVRSVNRGSAQRTSVWTHPGTDSSQNKVEESWSEALWSLSAPAESARRSLDEGGQFEAPSEDLNLHAFEHFSRRSGGHMGDPIDRYVEVLDRELADLRAAMAAGDADALARAAHRVRSHGGLVGAQAMNDAARQVETAAQFRSSESWRHGAETLFAAAAKLKSRLAAMRSGPARAG